MQKKLEIELPSQRQSLLKRIIDNPRNRSIVKLKAKVILLRKDGATIKSISEKLGISQRTVTNYIYGYKSKELSFIHQNKYKKSSLDSVDKLLDELKKPSNYKEAAKLIKDKYNITISESAVRRYLNKHKIYTKESETFHKNRGNWNNN